MFFHRAFVVGSFGTRGFVPSHRFFVKQPGGRFWIEKEALNRLKGDLGRISLASSHAHLLHPSIHPYMHWPTKNELAPSPQVVSPVHHKQSPPHIPLFYCMMFLKKQGKKKEAQLWKTGSLIFIWVHICRPTPTIKSLQKNLRTRMNENDSTRNEDNVSFIRCCFPFLSLSSIVPLLFLYEGKKVYFNNAISS